MVGIPTFLVVVLIWLPTIASIVLSFTSWNGIGGLDAIKFIGLEELRGPRHRLPAVLAGASSTTSSGWSVFLFIATPLGMFLAVLLDQNIRGTRIYQSALYMPVVLSLAIVGFIWQPHLRPGAGASSTTSSGRTAQGNQIDWLGDPNINLWAVLVAASWRHVGYIMVLYLAGLKAVDPALREAAAIDGASETQTFFRVVFPVMKPINIVIVVITVIESLRAFDIAFIINKGLNGLELLSTLVTNNIIGETSRIGFGSAIAVVLLVVSVGPIIVYLVRALREENAVTEIAIEPAGTYDGSAARRRKQLRRSGLHAFLIAISLVWLLPIAWAVYTSFRPYDETNRLGYVSIGGRVQPRQLHQRLEQGRARQVLHQHGRSSSSRPSSSCSCWPR